MHGHSPGSALFLNAEVDSMGGVVDGVGVDSKTSPRRAAIEKAQAELRQEFDVREERRRELEFLEKGGNPLDFKLGSAKSISVQSTSLTDQHADHEAKGSFALTASPHGDSVDSSGRPGVPAGREPNIADNLLLFDGENDTHDGEKKSVQPTRRGKIASSEQSSQQDGSHNAKESEDSAIFRLGMKNQAYARRNRTRSSRDASSTDLHPSGHGNGSSVFPSRHVAKDAKGPLREARMDKDRTVSSICNSKTTSPNGNPISKILASENQMDMELDAAQTHDTMTDLSRVRVSEDGADTAKIEQTQNSQASLVREGEGKVSAGTGCVSKAKTESLSNVVPLNGFKIANRDSSALENEGQNKRTHNVDTVAADICKKGLDSESSCTQIRHSLEDNVDSNLPDVPRKINSSPNGCSKEQLPAVEETTLVKESDQVKENEAKVHEADAIVDDAKPTNSDIHVKAQDEMSHGISDLHSELKSTTNDEAMEPTAHIALKLDGNPSNSVADKSNPKMTDSCSQVGLPGSSNAEPSEPTVPSKDSAVASELQNCPENSSKLVDGMHEDAILEEARIIEARLKRAGELSFCNAPSVKRRKSHWDFVLEEMAWLANDFMQERLWKTTAAAQMSHWVSSSGRLKFDEANLCRKQKKVARIFAKAIFQFWHSVEMLLKHNDPSTCLEEATLFAWQKADVGEAPQDKREEPLKLLGTVENLEEKNSGQNFRLPIQKYAVRFLKYNSSLDCPVQAEAPTTPERISDTGILEVTWDDQFSEVRESLFYAVPAGATENYRKSVESFWAKYEKL
ncbi:hypothetical protein ACLOJK_041478 [Asimina triloba]